MAPPKSVQPTPLNDDPDDLFGFDAGLEEIFANLHKSTEDNNNTARDPAFQPVPPAHRSEGLGIDEEITISKKRKPVAKLDDTRLLSDRGIPKLRKIAKKGLKFRGKGHEFSDVALLLRTYQLWLDELYPRAKFADGLAMIEKLGHSKRLQIMRKEWIDEGKARASANEDDAEPSHLSATVNPGLRTTGTEITPTSVPRADTLLRTDPDNPENDGFADQDANRAPHPVTTLESGESGEGPDDDELDALLAQETLAGRGTDHIHSFGSGPMQSLQRHKPPSEDAFEDDEAVMRELGM
ncbi:Swi3-domain-containing protein [Trichodelitschia bisporula]|uniref:Chromosome segregation in meiosis protein n=1 Tax=Trichodelitschia bisporula TaxID=703511 RepID=A0A6G1HK21_9PEZI|nr:Swi3-domain-containing protein [Trichodelitschia bisporula]